MLVWISEQPEVRRSWVPARQIGAIDNTLARWQDLFDLLHEHPELWESVRSDALLAKTEGRPRMRGEWGLIYLAFVNSAERELLRWHRNAPDELWERADFLQTPSYHATYKNFNALEARESAFRAVAAKLTQLAVEKSGGKVGHAVHVDGTEAEAHSRLIHDCQGDEMGSCGKQPLVPRRVTNADARDERHRLASVAPTEDDLHGQADEMAADERGLRVKVGGCWYLLSDDEAGVRAYTTGTGKVRTFWAGYYCSKAIDHYTGGVLAVHVTSASVQEHISYPELYEQVKEHLGTAPKAIVADRGFSVASVFEMHTRDGVASVIPWRAHWKETARKDHLPRYDRHGIPHCAHCGGEGTFHRFQHDAGPKAEPRLWFRCAKPSEPECERVQSLQCKENWRLLLPLWRTNPAYQVLKATHSHYEAAHHRWRERYAVAGDTKADRSKRRGMGVQQLRGSAALIIEWLTICHRQGWLGGPVINKRTETILTRDEAERSCHRIRNQRHALGLGVVDADDMADHQAEVLTAYQSPSVFGAGSAYGPDVVFDVEGAITGIEWQKAEPDAPPE